MQFRVSSFAAGALSAALAAASASAQFVPQHYTQTNLVSDLPGVAAVTDPNLVNPWGLSRASGGAWWVADNGTGLSTLYNGEGAIQPLVVTIPPGDSKSGSAGTPTGTIFNGGAGFEVAPGKPSIFLFVTEDGTISGWNPQVNPKSAIITVNTETKSVFKGATIATVPQPPAGPANFLYVADFRKGMIRVYDSKFNCVPMLERGFKDPRIPADYAPFNIQNIGGNLYVAYALQDGEKHDEVDGAGLGYVDVYSSTGVLLHRLDNGSWFNAPWGLVQASGDFGRYSHMILVGNFGSGQILVFDPVTGKFRGRLRDAAEQPIAISGLWGLSFGIGGASGPANSLYFAAGSNHEQDGLLGTITAVENLQGNDQ